MKVISYCLWGNNPKYTIGAIKNADLAEKLYPGWVCYFYCAADVPQEIINELSKRKNVLVLTANVFGNWKFTVSRFLPMSDTNVEFMISRDTDSRPSEREVNAVEEWIKSGKSAHIMRDHPCHGNYPMLAGMFGIKGGTIKNVNSLLSLMTEEEHYNFDQLFLAKYIYPLIEEDVLKHDEFFEKNPFPTKRNGLQFVGQVFDENDNTVLEHIQILNNHL
jgi:hypothetical protein